VCQDAGTVALAPGSGGRVVRVEVEADRCTGHGRCYVLAPEVFDSDDEGRALVVVTGELSPELEKQARIAEANCPEKAIHCA
jgi:ferredoxin